MPGGSPILSPTGVAKHTVTVDQSRPTYLFILNWPVDTPGGVNEVVLSVASRLSAMSRFRPLIAVTGWDHTHTEFSPARGVEVVYLRMREPLIHAGSSTIFGFFGFLSTLFSDIRSIRRLVSERHIEVINTHFPSLSACIPQLMKLTGLYKGCVALSFHGADITNAERTRFATRRAWQWLLRKSDISIACSSSLATSILNFVPEARVAAVHNGAELGLFRHPWQRNRPRRSVLHIGRYEHKKAQDILLKAFQRLRQSVPDIHLTLIGVEGPTLDETRDLVSELELTDCVEMHVNVPHEQLPGFTSRADLLVLPSRSEPFGIALVEGGAAGLPVVATRVGGVPELVDDGVTGMLVQPEDIEGLRAAMEVLMTNAAFADQLAQAWQEKVMRQFSWEATVRNYMRIIDEAAH